MFGINRVTRRARKLFDIHNKNVIPAPTYGVHHQALDKHLTSLTSMVEALTSRPLTAHNTITCLHDGDKAYPLMLEAIDAAQKAKDKLGDAIEVDAVKIDDPSNPENRQRAIDYQIMAVPTIVIDGDVVFVGAPTDFELIEKLESLL